METTRETTRPVREYHHGRTPAAWTGVVLAMFGFVLGSIAFMMGPAWTLVWIAAGFIAAGVVAGWALTLAGYGEQH